MVQMVSLSYGGCCVRGLCVIEVRRAKREEAAAVRRRLLKRNNKEPQHRPTQRDTQTGGKRRAARASMFLYRACVCEHVETVKGN